jgi:hypothetical protein
MSASLHVISEETKTPKEREKRARQEQSDARGRLIEAISRGDQAESVERLADKYECALLRHSWELERRAVKAERALRKLLDTDDLTDEQISRALSATYGHAGERQRNPGGMSDNERQIVEWYRTMDGDGRKMLRELCERLRAASEPADEAAR